MSNESEILKERKSDEYQKEVVVNFTDYREKVEKENDEKRKTQSKKRRSKGRGKGRGKGTRKKKDPNAPKRPKSAYLFFSMEERPRLRKKHPKMGFGPLSKRLGKEWKSLSDDEKKHYEKMAKKDKKRYEDEMDAYEKKGSSKSKSKEASEDD